MNTLSILMEQANVRANEATSLQASEGRITLVPSTDPIVFKTKLTTEATGELDLDAAILCPKLVLTEANFYTQLHSAAQVGTKDPSQWMNCVEWSIAAPGAQVGAIDEVTGDFVPLPFYSTLRVLTEQTPMIYGQHMRCEAEAWAACHKLLLDAGYVALEVGTGDNSATRSAKRKAYAHIGAPTRAGGTGNYGSELPQRIRNGLAVDKAVLLSNQDDTREGFTDPLRSLFANVERAARDGVSTNEDTRKSANRLVSSLTGIGTWENDQGRTMKAPIRAGIADITIANEPFNMWTSTNAPVGAPVGSTAGAPDPFKQA